MGSNEEAKQDVSVVVHFRDMATDESVRDHLTSRCHHFAEEFPETTHYELTLERDADAVLAHGHVVGKGTDAAARANGVADIRAAGDAMLDKLHTELRRHHDKRIFTQRRKEQKKRATRGS